MIGERVRVARDLNASGRWTIYAHRDGRWKPTAKVDSLRLEDVSFKISASGVERIRTPKGSHTSTGARGLGKRTVCAFAVGTLAQIGATPTGGDRLTFNPFKDDSFKIEGQEAPAQVDGLAFTEGGLVEVIGAA